MRVIQRELQSQLRTRAAAARDRIDALVRPLTPSQLDAHPEPNGWSVAQVLEHLCLAGDLSEAPAAEVLRTARAAGDFDWLTLRIPSPAMPAWAPKMNLGDGFRIHTVHVERHSRQIERLVGKL